MAPKFYSKVVLPEIESCIINLLGRMNIILQLKVQQRTLWQPWIQRIQQQICKPVIKPTKKFSKDPNVEVLEIHVPIAWSG